MAYDLVRGKEISEPVTRPATDRAFAKFSTRCIFPEGEQNVFHGARKNLRRHQGMLPQTGGRMRIKECFTGKT